MIEIDTKKVLDELEKSFGDGPLTLGIFCTKCNAQFELNRDGAALAVLFDTSFIEYVRWVQTSKCSACGAESSQ